MTVPDGIHTVGSEQYHADQLDDTPSLSRSIARLLLSRSPRHAWWNHPRLNPQYQPKVSGTLDHGTAVHALLFEGKSPCVCHYDDWRTNAAKAERDEARANGLVPLLAKDAEVVTAMCEALDQQLSQFTPRPFTGGKAEQSIKWTEPNGVVCRARVDYLTDDRRHMWDLKTTGTSADPREWCRRRLWEDGLDLQCAMYRRGVRATTGVTPEWAFVVMENTPPYAVSVISLTPDALRLAEEKLDRAIVIWKACLDSGEWPAYPAQIAFAELPPWEEARWLERQALVEMAEEVAA